MNTTTVEQLLPRDEWRSRLALRLAALNHHAAVVAEPLANKSAVAGIPSGSRDASDETGVRSAVNRIAGDPLHDRYASRSQRVTRWTAPGLLFGELLIASTV